MSGIKYYVLDTETNGLMSNYHEITEISIIKAEDKRQLFEKVRCEYPERSSLDALRITGKSIHDLKNGKSQLEIVDMVDRFLNLDNLTSGNRCIIAHNSTFDRKFCHALWAKMERKFPADLWLDTIPMFKKYTKENSLVTKSNLTAACDTLQIKKSGSAHNASSDTRNTFYLWKKLCDIGINPLPFIKTEPHILKGQRLNQNEVDDLLGDINEDLLND